MHPAPSMTGQPTFQMLPLLMGLPKYSEQLEMWANAQRDGHPAEYRWQPLFNAAKFG